MDPLSQGALGAALPQASSSSQRLFAAGLLGFLAGMAPDLDVLIRSDTDPLLFLEYHRQFTHALSFIPFGGLLCALLLHPLLGRRLALSFKLSWLFCTLGYATHALLDACTTYGTLLLWPFSDTRFAWNTISIIDPLFTLPLLLAVVLTAWRGRQIFVRLALLWCCCYMALGLMQRERAEAAGWQLAQARGHQPVRLEAKPSFGNILLWKTVYETPQHYYVDAVRAGTAVQAIEGESIAKLVVARDFPWLDPRSQQARDIERFRWFSNDYLAVDRDKPNRIIDIRYSMLPNEISALWGIELSRQADDSEHVRYNTVRDADDATASKLWRMLADDL